MDYDGNDDFENAAHNADAAFLKTSAKFASIATLLTVIVTFISVGEVCLATVGAISFKEARWRMFAVLYLQLRWAIAGYKIHKNKDSTEGPKPWRQRIHTTWITWPAIGLVGYGVSVYSSVWLGIAASAFSAVWVEFFFPWWGRFSKRLRTLRKWTESRESQEE